MTDEVLARVEALMSTVKPSENRLVDKVTILEASILVASEGFRK